MNFGMYCGKIVTVPEVKVLPLDTDKQAYICKFVLCSSRNSFDGIKYEYKIADIYDVDKTGTVNISRDKNRTTITLITCKKYSKDKQTVFIGYLSNKEAY